MTAGAPSPASRHTTTTPISAGIAAMGWTSTEWDDTFRFLVTAPDGTYKVQAAVAGVHAWLRNPPYFSVPISAATVQDVFTRHGKQTAPVLSILATGGTERFAVAFVNQPHWPVPKTSPAQVAEAATDGWRFARSLGLAEQSATGWAATGYLHTSQHQPAARESMTALIKEWTDLFGPTAYLWVLAGFDLDEATAMRDAHTTPTQEQLRVMVALNGHVLPDGV